jgi:hypothetical protein
MDKFVYWLYNFAWEEVRVMEPGVFVGQRGIEGIERAENGE